METKSPFLSKTLWLNFIVALVAFIPVAGQFVASHPELFVVVFAVVNIVLRLVSHGKLELS